ncbi:hypothetical protein CHUAL_005337 [Chamberlinius hualienensis]
MLPSQTSSVSSTNVLLNRTSLTLAPVSSLSSSMTANNSKTDASLESFEQVSASLLSQLRTDMRQFRPSLPHQNLALDKAPSLRTPLTTNRSSYLPVPLSTQPQTFVEQRPPFSMATRPTAAFAQTTISPFGPCTAQQTPYRLYNGYFWNSSPNFSGVNPLPRDHPSSQSSEFQQPSLDFNVRPTFVEPYMHAQNNASNFSNPIAGLSSCRYTSTNFVQNQPMAGRFNQNPSNIPNFFIPPLTHRWPSQPFNYTSSLSNDDNVELPGLKDDFNPRDMELE